MLRFGGRVRTLGTPLCLLACYLVHNATGLQTTPLSRRAILFSPPMVLVTTGAVHAADPFDDFETRAKMSTGQVYVDPLPLPTIRGIWRITGEIKDPLLGSSAPSIPIGAEVEFRGFDSSPNRGTVIYRDMTGGDVSSRRSARGSWLQKPARITRGQVRWSARWNAKFPAPDPEFPGGGLELIFRGDTETPAPDDFDFLGNGASPSIPTGTIYAPAIGGMGNLEERRIGFFRATRVKGWDEMEQGKL